MSAERFVWLKNFTVSIDSWLVLPPTPTSYHAIARLLFSFVCKSPSRASEMAQPVRALAAEAY